MDDIQKMENGYESVFKLISEVEDLKDSIHSQTNSDTLFDQMKGIDVTSEGV